MLACKKKPEWGSLERFDISSPCIESNIAKIVESSSQRNLYVLPLQCIQYCRGVSFAKNSFFVTLSPIVPILKPPSSLEPSDKQDHPHYHPLSLLSPFPPPPLPARVLLSLEVSHIAPHWGWYNVC